MRSAWRAEFCNWLTAAQHNHESRITNYAFPLRGISAGYAGSVF
jgi:hypothetical protein